MHHPNENTDIILMAIGSITGLIGLSAEDIDLVLGIFLKLISIVSFFVVVVINMPKFIKTIKELWKK